MSRYDIDQDDYNIGGDSEQKFKPFNGFDEYKERAGENRLHVLPCKPLSFQTDENKSVFKNVSKKFGLVVWRSFTNGRTVYAPNTFYPNLPNPIKDRYRKIWDAASRKYGAGGGIRVSDETKKLIKEVAKNTPGYNEYRATNRFLACVIDCHPDATEEERNTVKIWDMPFKVMQEILGIAVDGNGDNFPFWHPDRCSEIKFTKTGVGIQTERTKITVSRPDDKTTRRISDEVLDQVIPFDKIIDVPTVDEALEIVKAQDAKIANGDADGDDVEYTRPAKSAPRDEFSGGDDYSDVTDRTYDENPVDYNNSYYNDSRGDDARNDRYETSTRSRAEPSPATATTFRTRGRDEVPPAPTATPRSRYIDDDADTAADQLADKWNGRGRTR